MRLQCLRGPYDGTWQEVAPDRTSYFITYPDMFRGRYDIMEVDGKLRLVFDPVSSPAWTSEEFPVRVTVGDRTYEVWTTNPFGPNVEMRWMIRDGDEAEALSEVDADVDTSYEELSGWVQVWEGSRRRHL